MIQVYHSCQILFVLSKNYLERGSLTAPLNNTQSVINSGHAAEIVGYMPKRGDFEV